jgi:ribonuclease HI
LNFPNLSIQATPLDKKKDDYNPEELRRIAIEKIDSIEADIAIYTDGSTDGNQESGGAGIYIETATGEELLRQSAPAGMYCSSFAGECVALLLALEWIERFEKTWHRAHSIIICTDSMSLTDALDSGNWKDPDHWIRRIKQTLMNITSNITLLWIPSHVDIAGNEVADELANNGRDMDQTAVHVSQKIVKARIKRQKWSITRPDAKLMYGDRLSPRMDIEKMWPRQVRTLFARIRTGDAPELRSYQHFINAADDDLCEEGCGKPDTNIHALCECNATEEARQREWHGEVVISMMVSHPEVARRILRHRFHDLYLNTERSKNTLSSNPSARCHRR